MDEGNFHHRLNDLLQKLNRLPEAQRTRIESLIQASRERRERIRASVSELQESLDYLRLSVKYLVFDLEATRRENAHLRRLVEQSHRPPVERPHTGEESRLDEECPEDERDDA